MNPKVHRHHQRSPSVGDRQDFTTRLELPSRAQFDRALQRLQAYLKTVPTDAPTRYSIDLRNLDFRDRPRLMTARQVADVLGVSEKTIFKWAANGLLPSVRLGQRALRFDPRAVEHFIQRGQRGEVD